MQTSISDYALIGDCETAALVSREGSIDWLCWPRFDSGACFAALLGTGQHGAWTLGPAGGSSATSRRYLDDTLVLETVFTTKTGEVSVTDFMPVRDGRPLSELVRIVSCGSGQVDMNMSLTLRFDYGRIKPWIVNCDEGNSLQNSSSRLVRAVAGPHSTFFSTPVDIAIGDGIIQSDFRISEGQRLCFILAYEASHLPPPRLCCPETALSDTRSYWRAWSEKSVYQGPWKEEVSRSLLTVKALIYSPTGGIVAAPTTSLPEQPGGSRNWDYRYCWLRDASFVLGSLLTAGYRSEAAAWCDWLLRAIAGGAEQIQPLYGIGGEHRCDEKELDWLPGYQGSKPVRVGNGAYQQLQIDTFGFVMDTLHSARVAGLTLNRAADNLQQDLLRRLTDIWMEPDEGIWEVRGGRRHFVHSRLMAWVAFDRGVRSSERFGLKGPVAQWRQTRDEIHADIITNGFNRERGAFVQYYGGDSLDAALLQMPLLGFLPADDPRMIGTVHAIEENLMRDGLLLRYDLAETDDGLPHSDSAFLACSFWLVDNMILQGRIPEAEALFRKLLSLQNDVGLLSEQFNFTQGALVGNFPQAFSHFSIIDSAFRLSRARGAIA